MDRENGLDLIIGRRAALRLTPGERTVLATAPVQRMARLRQTGLGYLTMPASEHTRLVHCLGTMYWTDRIVRSLTRNGEAALAAVDKLVGGGGAVMRVSRLLALAHDCSLLPLGHTIKHQLGFSNSKTSVLRLLLDQLSRIRLECRASAEWHAHSEDFVRDLDGDLRLAEWAVVASQLARGGGAITYCVLKSAPSFLERCRLCG
ncbi:MAG TPA: hypothetical protein VH640_12185 [Bryobacteraceae bacterium]|jgi:hypothetical protein